MQVSNSTGQGSDYRIGTNAGGINTVQPSGDSLDGGRTSTGGTTEELIIGTLAPGASELCATSGSVWVEFKMNDTVVACGSYSSDPGQVSLVERDGGYVVEVVSDASAAA